MGSVDQPCRKEQKNGTVDHNTPNVTFSAWSPSTWFNSLSSKRASPLLAKNVGDQAATDGCPIKHEQSGAGCPVKHEGSQATPFPLPASLEESARHAQTPHPDQHIPLSTHRAISSIPRADELRDDQSVAPHQPAEARTWVYPSEQQFYNAMRRKGWNGIDESTIPQVVQIHNAVNERGWSHIRRWERVLHNNHEPRLVKFLGRPKDMSPRAFMNTYLLWYNPPFDRHDWYVDGGDNKPPRRYVIDFYNGQDPTSNIGSDFVSSIVNRLQGKRDQQHPPMGLPSMYIDVRPALDSPEALFDRIKMGLIEEFPGIYTALQRRSQKLKDIPANTDEKASK